MKDDEFFIGWQGKAPPKTGSYLKGLVILGLAIVLVVAVLVPMLQGTVAQDATFDFGNHQEFSGVLVKDPVPMLVGDDDMVRLLVRDREGAATYFLLVGENGEAVNDEVLKLVAEPVAVTGRLKRRGKQLVLYADPAGIRVE
jgi:uncharacterized membrane protein